MPNAGLTLIIARTIEKRTISTFVLNELKKQIFASPYEAEARKINVSSQSYIMQNPCHLKNSRSKFCGALWPCLVCIDVPCIFDIVSVQNCDIFLIHKLIYMICCLYTVYSLDLKQNNCWFPLQKIMFKDTQIKLVKTVIDTVKWLRAGGGLWCALCRSHLSINKDNSVWWLIQNTRIFFQSVYLHFTKCLPL